MGAEIKVDAKGRMLPGYSLNPSGRPKSGRSLTDLIKAAMSEEMEISLGKELAKVERKRIMAAAFAQVISTGQVVLPDRIIDGQLVKGRVFNYTGKDWMEYMIRILRYIEPPVQEIEVSGGVDGILFDKDIDDNSGQRE